jgi:hypothetical protein
LLCLILTTLNKRSRPRRALPETTPPSDFGVLQGVEGNNG